MEQSGPPQKKENRNLLSSHWLNSRSMIHKPSTSHQTSIFSRIAQDQTDSGRTGSLFSGIFRKNRSF